MEPVTDYALPSPINGGTIFLPFYGKNIFSQNHFLMKELLNETL